MKSWRRVTRRPNVVDQLSEQEPGPLGSPHDPHGPALEKLGALFGALTAKTDSCLSSSTLAQEGHEGVWFARVRYSNLLPQARHAYSNKGMPIL